MAKLVPAVPRVAIRMGTCGSGNGAEVPQALAQAVGCFGAAFRSYW